MSYPTENVSSNGQEVWDWADGLSANIHKQATIRDLSARIRLLGTRCGDCDKWMKSSICPREKNVKGRLFGPSCNSPICTDFVECEQTTSDRAKLTAELQVLRGDPND